MFSISYRWMDIAQRGSWAFVSVWIGANAVLFYILDRFVDFDRLVLDSIGNDIGNAIDQFGGAGPSRLMANAAGLGLVVALAHSLHVRKIFLRL